MNHKMIRNLARVHGAALATAACAACFGQPVLVTSPATINPGDTTIAGVPLATAAITVRGTTLTVNGEHSIASLRVEDNGAAPGVVTHAPSFVYTDGGGSTRFGFHITTTGAVTVVGGAIPSSIDASAAGASAGSGPGSLPFNGGGRGGASYAGRGGLGASIDSAPCYGSVEAPIDFGSGGQPDCGGGATSGGCAWLSVGGTCSIDGAVRSDAGASGACGSGGASGGTVRISAATLAGSGTISADGGPPQRSDAGAGGGGRISLTYSGSTFGGTVHARGGLGGNQNGGAGTVHVKPAGAATLTIENGGTVGATTDFDAPYVLTGSLVVGPGAAVSHRSGVAGATISISGSATVQAGGALDISGRGYLGGSGPGSLPFNGGGRGGASHGGRGGRGDVIDSVACYGSFLMPTDLGSGGQPDAGFAAPGGGALRLNVSGTLTVDGAIRADAVAAGASGSGGGAGGSIWITTGSLAGSGAVTADGNVPNRIDAGAGGGGRIAAYYASNGFTGAIHAAGGAGSSAPKTGGAGSVYLKPSVGLGTLIYDNTGLAGATTDLSGTVAVPGHLLVKGNAAVSHISGDPGVTITVAGNATVASDGEVSTFGRGFTAGNGPGTTPFQGGGRAGASHGGRGGPGAAIGPSPLVYGSFTQPTMLGSGSAPDCGGGAAGGGSLRISVAGTLTVNGRIGSDAALAGACGSGGAAGGSVWIDAGSLAGGAGGVISANGGFSNRFDSADGGGGRVAVYSGTTTFAGSIQARGGVGASAGLFGGAGTVYTKRGSSPGTLTIDNFGTAGNTTDFAGNTGIDGTLVVRRGGVVSHAEQAAGLNLDIGGDCLIEADGAISTQGRGFGPASGPGSSPFQGGGRAGASYGGLGGDGAVQASSPTYGSSVAPRDLGSGGPADCGFAASGGGSIALTVGGVLRVDGSLDSNGGAVVACGSGGASGGSVLAVAGSVRGAGVIGARGGPSGRSDAGGGGGGRVAVYSCDIGVPLANIDVGGGAGFNSGQPGTRRLVGAAAAVTPGSVRLCQGGSIVFSLELAGFPPFTFQWRRNGAPIPGATMSSLSVTNVGPGNAGTYDALVSNGCGTVVATAASLAVCAADFNCSGEVSVQDIFDFLAGYFSGDPRADINRSGAIGVQDIFDFLASYFAGCA